MIAMSNFEEFARAVGSDVKSIKDQQLTKSEFNSKDCITGNSEYDFLKRSVQELEKQNKLLQEQLALVKPSPRRAPMAYTIDLNSTPPIAWFDNGCGLDTGGSILLGKDKSKNLDRTLPGWDFPNAILRTSLAVIDIEVWKKSDFTYWGDHIKVLNPIKSADDYDWTNARISEKGATDSWRWNNQKNLIRIMYQLGIWDAKTIGNLGAVRR